MSTTYRFLLLPGDGIGPEIMAAAEAVLAAVATRFGLHFETPKAPIGGAGIASQPNDSGLPLPAATQALAQELGVVLLAAVGSPRYDAIEPSRRPEQGLLAIRKAMGLFANIRPVTLYPALANASTLRPEVIEGIDLVVVRELTGGLYFGQPKVQAHDHAIDTLSYQRHEIERIAHTAFKLAQTRRKQLCSADKANVLASSRLWRAVVDELAPQYPDVAVTHQYVDNTAMQLVRNPRQFDVILTENTFGDILSDEASMLTGSLGMLPSASFGSNGMALYEPCHGSAPDIAGQDKANPIAQILSLAMLLEQSFGLVEPAKAIETAVAHVLAQGLRTPDIASEGTQVVGTQALTQAIVQFIAQATLSA